MSTTKDSFLDLERHRQMLEENVKKLSDALDYWKQYQTEYKALRNEVNNDPEKTSRQRLREIRSTFKGEKLDEKELDSLFGRNTEKKAEVVLSTLTNRLDYVTKNVDTLGKQVNDAKNKLAAVSVVTNPDMPDEEGFPITEIMEELDDEDNVVSYSLRTPGDNRPQILETLKKAGITDFSAPADTDATDATDSTSEQPEASQATRNAPAQQSEGSQVAEEPKESPVAKKKSVTFTDDTKSGDQPQQTDTAKRLEEILQKAKDQQSIISDPVFPADESEEDASLREDMIRYNKETMKYEMAPIVAELQLEEGSSDDDSDDYSDYDEDEDEEAAEELDELGRTKLKVDDEWKARMLELDTRLKAYEFGKEGDDEEGMVEEGIGRITIKRQGQDTSNGDASSLSATKPKPQDSTGQDTKKSVRFAQTLDIADESALTAPLVPADEPQTQRKHDEVDPLSELVMERTSAAPQPPSARAPAPAKKASRFKKARGNEAPVDSVPKTLGGIPITLDRPDPSKKITPSGPEGQTLANSVLEHEPSLEAKGPDEFDADLMQKQAAEEYYKLRNKLVYQQGGFMKEDENPIQPLDEEEEEEGPKKRVSRFKAARLAKS
ncbi:hypothetical protein M426DRAFT_221089 [Hypoxylon sp. CI-4A]|nr:hypothetical protein M426DRAFT_221089 [Hypoxylon sp. CI-4A]